MTKLPSSQIELRKAVAALLENPIEDIEQIWRALSGSERKQLRPVIEAAAGISDKASALLAQEPAPIPSDKRSPGSVGGTIEMIRTMPAALAARLFESLDPEIQEAVAERVPQSNRGGSNLDSERPALTEYARSAWLELCTQHAACLAPDNDQTVAERRSFRPSDLLRPFRRAKNHWLADKV